MKSWLHRDLSRLDKLLLILASFGTTCQVREIVESAARNGLREPRNWNVSDILSRSKGLAIRTTEGWEISEAGRQHLHSIGVSSICPVAVEVASGLRVELAKIRNPETYAFVEEAIKCYEAHLFRSAIVMSWLAAIDVLYRHVIENHLNAFNAEAKRVDSKWKTAKTSDDLGRMRESDFLDRIAAISVIGKNVKAELKICLDRRNGCGHPNSLKIGGNTVTHHIEVLLLNVFEPFAP
jgi:hypothetical protein